MSQEIIKEPSRGFYIFVWALNGDESAKLFRRERYFELN